MPVDLEICLVTAFSQHLWRSNVSLLADVSLVCSYIGEQTSDFNHTALFGALCKTPQITVPESHEKIVVEKEKKKRRKSDNVTIIEEDEPSS